MGPARGAAAGLTPPSPVRAQMVPPTAFPGPQPPGPPPGASYGGGGFAAGPPGGFAAGPPGGVGSQAQAPLPGGRKGAGPNGEARYACEIGGARSVAQVGMDGLKVFDGSGQRCLHVYPLESIMKWSTPGATQLLWDGCHPLTMPS